MEIPYLANQPGSGKAMIGSQVIQEACTLTDLRSIECKEEHNRIVG